MPPARGAARGPPPAPRGVARGASKTPAASPARGAARGPPPAPRGVARGASKTPAASPARGAARGPPPAPRGVARGASKTPAASPARGAARGPPPAPRGVARGASKTPAASPARGAARGPPPAPRGVARGASKTPATAPVSLSKSTRSLPRPKPSASKSKPTGTSSPSSSASSAEDKRLAAELAKIKSETRKLEAQHRANQQKVAKLQKARQQADLEAIKKAEATLAEKKSERLALEQRVKDLEQDNGRNPNKGGRDAALARLLPDLARKTRALDDLAQHMQNRVEQRQRDLVDMRSKLNKARQARREMVTQMTVEFDAKRDELASAHKNLRSIPGMKTTPVVVKMEDQHRNLIVDGTHALKLLSARHDGNEVVNGNNNLRHFSSPGASMGLTRSYDTEMFLMEHKFVSPQSAHPSNYKGVDQLFTRIHKKGEHSDAGAGDESNNSNSVPVADIIIVLNDLAKDAPSLWQELYERATALFVPRMGVEPGRATEALAETGPTVSRGEYLDTVEQCEDFLVQGLLLADSSAVNKKMIEEAKEYTETANTLGQAIDAQTVARSVYLAEYNNELFQSLLERHRELTVGALRSEYESERAESFRLFERKLRKAQEEADERLGQLKFLPHKIDQAESAVESNKTLLHAMRVHFEQVRLAAKLEHKSMEAQLRKIARHMHKAQGRIDAIEEREQRLKDEVTARVRAIWEPEVDKERKRLEEAMDKVRVDVTARMENMEDQVKEKVNNSFKGLLWELEEGLEDAQVAMERNHAIFEEKSREAREVHANLEELLRIEAAVEAEEASAKQLAEANAEAGPSKEDIERIAAARKRCRQLWAANETPIEQQIAFLEAVVNEASETDEALLRTMQRYRNQIAMFS